MELSSIGIGPKGTLFDLISTLHDCCAFLSSVAYRSWNHVPLICYTLTACDHGAGSEDYVRERLLLDLGLPQHLKGDLVASPVAILWTTSTAAAEVQRNCWIVDQQRRLFYQDPTVTFCQSCGRARSNCGHHCGSSLASVPELESGIGAPIL